MKIRNLISTIYEQAKALDACDLFTGEEQTLQDIVALFLTPQGMEFCQRRNFPSLAIFRQFKSLKVEKMGIYIDAGEVTLNNPEKAVLIGDTQAKIFCFELKPCHEIYLLHGAKALVDCWGWAVTRIQSADGCKVVKNATEHAVIL